MLKNHSSLHYRLLRASVALTLLVTGTLCTSQCDAAPPAKAKAEKVGQYLQQVRVNYTEAEGLPANQTSCLVSDQELYAGTQKGIARFKEQQWKLVLETKTAISALATLGDQLVYATDDHLGQLVELGVGKVIAELPNGLKVTELTITPQGVFVGTNNGLHHLIKSDNEEAKLVAVNSVNELLPPKTIVNQLAWSSKNGLAIATTNGLITYQPEQKTATRTHAENATGGWFLKDVRGVGFDSKHQMWIATLQGVGYQTAKGWKLFTGNDGLPYNDFTGLAVGPNDDVWFTTHIGAVHWDHGNWEYRQGKRWLLNDDLNNVTITANGDAWFSTQSGVSRIELRPTTFQQKADFFDTEIDQFHKRTEYGYVDTVNLPKPGLKENVQHRDSDNDGLWTSMYGAAQCYAYAVTRSPESKRRAQEAFRAIAFLSEVTQGGEHPAPFGFPARTILPIDGRNPNDHDNRANDQRRRDERDPLWKIIEPRWPVNEDKKWYWKTDTSSDELDGHYFFYGLYYDLVAETEKEKAEVRKVVDRISTHLIENNYELIDHDGKPTRWGRFGPHVINTDYLTDLRGLNAISLLSYIIVAEHVTGDEKYRREYNKLLEEHNYYTNVLHPKAQNGPGTGNQSDDEMAFMCYYNLFAYEKDARLRKQYTRSMARYFAQEQYEHCPLFNFIFALNYTPPKWYWPELPENIIPEAVESLKRYPLDRVTWSIKNSHRLDVVPVGKHVIRSQNRGHLRNGHVLPIDERFVEHWNHDPWRLDYGGGGRRLADGASFLLPYYMGVYHGFIVDESIPSAKVESSTGEE